MVQFNLLPDVKKDYIKSKRTKRLIASISFLVTAVFVGIAVLMFLFVRFAQTKSINDLTADIESKTTQIQASEDLQKKLTVQNQLTILTPLHEGKPEVSRVFDYVRFFSPETAELNELSLDTSNGSMSISGNISTLAEANRLVDNIKAVTFASYAPGDDIPDTLNNTVYTVVDSSVSSDGEEARFQIDIDYDATIFDNTLEIIMQLRDRKISTAGDVKVEDN